jgi:hypothetical protein
MLREQNPTELADAAITRSVEEKERDEAELIAVRQEEICQRQAKLKKFTGARYYSNRSFNCAIRQLKSQCPCLNIELVRLKYQPYHDARQFISLVIYLKPN